MSAGPDGAAAELSSRAKSLSIIPHFTGALSILGSSYIAYAILRHHRRKRQRTTQRILLALSLCDIISSFAYFLSTWPLPQGVNDGWGDPYHYAALGNDATCTAQGVMIQFGVVSAFYNVSLSVRYLTIVRRNVPECALQQRGDGGGQSRWKRRLCFWLASPWLPLVLPPLVALGLTLPGIFLGMYANSNLWCWIATNWSSCPSDQPELCVRRTNVYRFIFYYGPLWASIGITVAAQIMMWRSVRDIEKRSRRYVHRTSRSSLIVSSVANKGGAGGVGGGEAVEMEGKERAVGGSREGMDNREDEERGRMGSGTTTALAAVVMHVEEEEEDKDRRFSIEDYPKMVDDDSSANASNWQTDLSCGSKSSVCDGCHHDFTNCSNSHETIVNDGQEDTVVVSRNNSKSDRRFVNGDKNNKFPSPLFCGKQQANRGPFMKEVSSGRSKNVLERDVTTISHDGIANVKEDNKVETEMDTSASTMSTDAGEEEGADDNDDSLGGGAGSGHGSSGDDNRSVDRCSDHDWNNDDYDNNIINDKFTHSKMCAAAQEEGAPKRRRSSVTWADRASQDDCDGCHHNSFATGSTSWRRRRTSSTRLSNDYSSSDDGERSFHDDDDDDEDLFFEDNANGDDDEGREEDNGSSDAGAGAPQQRRRSSVQWADLEEGGKGGEGCRGDDIDVQPDDDDFDWMQPSTIDRQSRRSSAASAASSTAAGVVQLRYWKEEDRHAYRRSRKIARQSVLYFAVFFITWFPYTFTSLVMNIWFKPSNDGYWMLLVIVICQPLQGFLNCLVYNKRSIKRYLRRIRCCDCGPSCLQRHTPEEEEEEEDATSNSSGCGCRRRGKRRGRVMGRRNRRKPWWWRRYGLGGAMGQHRRKGRVLVGRRRWWWVVGWIAYDEGEQLSTSSNRSGESWPPASPLFPVPVVPSRRGSRDTPHPSATSVSDETP